MGVTWEKDGPGGRCGRRWYSSRHSRRRPHGWLRRQLREMALAWNGVL